MPFHLDQNLKEYATESQWRMLTELEKHGSERSAAAATGRHKSRFGQVKMAVLKKAAMHGYAPDYDMTHPVAPGYKVKGTSTLYDVQSGEARLQWVKTDADKEAQEAAIKEAVVAMCDDLPRLPKRREKVRGNDDLISVVPMGDPHFGMYAWAEEAGEDFDLDIAKRDLCAAVDYLVSQSPASKRCVLINLGDFFHVDNLKNMTSQNGNVLDVDTRLPKMIRVGVTALRQAIETALDRHETVEIINAIGNHDGVLSMALSIMLANIYEKEHRVVVRDEPTPRHYLEHGKCLVGVTHGNRTKDRDLPGIMATEMPEAWGRTKYRYFYRGHEHHDSLEMFNGCTVEQFSTLAPNDAWHNAAGYMTGRNMKMIVLHREFGEVARSVCSIEMLRHV